MPRGDKTKEPAFRMWREGKPLPEIQKVICGSSTTLPGSIAGWVRDWERGAQGAWTPDPAKGTNARRHQTPLLRELSILMEEFASHYLLWLIAARIAMWTREPPELDQAHDMMDKSRERLERISGFIRRNHAEFPEAVGGLLAELLAAAQLRDLQPSAEVFNRKTEEIHQITGRIRLVLQGNSADPDGDARRAISA